MVANHIKPRLSLNITSIWLLDNPSEFASLEKSYIWDKTVCIIIFQTKRRRSILFIVAGINLGCISKFNQIVSYSYIQLLRISIFARLWKHFRPFNQSDYTRIINKTTEIFSSIPIFLFQNKSNSKNLYYEKEMELHFSTSYLAIYSLQLRFIRHENRRWNYYCDK